MTSKPKPPFGALLQQPRVFVARLILAELVAKRGEGPLERKRLSYVKRKR